MVAARSVTLASGNPSVDMPTDDIKSRSEIDSAGVTVPAVSAFEAPTKCPDIVRFGSCIDKLMSLYLIWRWLGPLWVGKTFWWG